MTVWILFKNHPFEGEDVEGVFTTKDLAEAAGRELDPSPYITMFPRADWSVEEYELQESLVAPQEIQTS